MSWPMVKVRDIAVSHYGKALKKENRINSGSYAVFGSSGQVGLHSEKLVNYPTLIVGRKGSVGQIVWAPEGGWVIDTAYYLELKEQGAIDLRFLFYALKRADLAKRTITTSIPGLNRDDFYDTEIPLPPLTEQKRIATILDKADAIRRKRQQAIQLADNFLRAVFLDMFGDPGANPKDFEEAALGDLTSGKTNNGLFRKNDEYGGSVPVAWVGELFRGNRISFSEEAKRIEPTEKEIDAYGLKYGDLLFCRSSLKLEGIGFNNIYLGDNDNALFECHLIRMSPCLEKVNPIFLNYQLRMPSIRARIFQQAKTSTMTTIDQAGLSRIRVTVPPLDLQEEFQRRLLNVEGLYSHLYKSKSLDELAFSSISQKAFQDGL